MPNVREIVCAWLKERSYEGLAGDECGCGIENLMPCGGCSEDGCVAGHRVAPDSEECRACPNLATCYVIGDARIDHTAGRDVRYCYRPGPVPAKGGHGA